MTGLQNQEGISAGKTAEPRVASLKQKHATLESALEHENSRPLPDSKTVVHLKREKLAIKDELERLTQN